MSEAITIRKENESPPIKGFVNFYMWIVYLYVFNHDSRNTFKHF